jgi:hypothetical protein
MNSQRFALVAALGFIVTAGCNEPPAPDAEAMKTVMDPAALVQPADISPETTGDSTASTAP